MRKGARFWRVPQHSAGVLNDGALDLDEVADEFAGGPAVFGGAAVPLISGNGVSGSKELLLGASEILGYRLKRGHGFILSHDA